MYSYFCLYLCPFPEADLSLHMLSESPCGSSVVYVIPEVSSLLPEVKAVHTSIVIVIFFF